MLPDLTRLSYRQITAVPVVKAGDVGLSAEPPDLLVGHWTLEMDIGPRVCKIQTDVNAFPRASMLCPEKH